MNFPFNFIPPQFPQFFQNAANYPPQNDFSFFSNPFFGQPFFNNPGNPPPPQQHYNEFNPFHQNTDNKEYTNSPKKTFQKNNDIQSDNFKTSPSEHLKKLGNDFFKTGNYPEAIKYYTQAIEKDSNQTIYYLNRALCFKYLRKFNETLKDCGSAIELDDQNYKAHLLMGRTLAEIGKMDNTTQRIDKALLKIEKAIKIYNHEQNKSDKILKELKTYFRRVQKLLWYKSKELIKAQNSDIYSYMKNSLKNDACLSEESKNQMMKNLEIVVANPYKNEENNYIVPDEFCCKITLDLMDEPYLCPSGVSYEGNVLFEHLKAHDFDPVTRETLSVNQIFPNMTLKIAIENFVSKNPWAFEYMTGENYLYLEF